MMQEKKSLLLQDLCARLPYEVKVTWSGKHSLTVTPHIYCAIASEDNIKNLPKLLLRPMSSMTEEEKIESLEFAWEDDYGKLASYEENIPKYIDWLNKKMFDYRGLIPMGLALEAPKGMYNIN